MGVQREKALIALDKGLGKTVVTNAVIESLIEEGYLSSGLVVVPASLKYQWGRKIRQFSDDSVSVCVIGDTKAERAEQYKRAVEGVYDYTIVSYNNVVDEWDIISELPRDFVVADEATYIKGFRSKRSRKVKALTAPVRIGLTGSPIENRPEEVYSIMQWVDSSVLGSYEFFDKTFIKRDKFGSVKYYRNLPTLHGRLKEAMVRKTWFDADVRDEMPHIAERTLRVPFDRTTARLYNKVRGELLNDLENMRGSPFDVFAYYAGEMSAEDNTQRGRIMQKVTALRMLCDHPALLRISADKFAEWSEEMRTKAQQGSRYAHGLFEDGLVPESMETPKMEATLDLIVDIVSESPSNKIVLFSTFKPTVFILQSALRDEGIDAVVYHGDMTPKQKDKAVVDFGQTDSIKVFLSTDAGGYGLDIPEANYLINYDLPWSAGALGQRNGRIMRLSSQFDTVHFINVIMENSIEDRQLSMLLQKQAIASAVLDGKGVDLRGRLNLNLDSLRTFMQDAAV